MDTKTLPNDFKAFLKLLNEHHVEEKTLIRFGVCPMQIEILTTIPGIAFDDCYQRKSTKIIDGVAINFINLDDLQTNKLATGRLKELTDVDMLQKLNRRRKSFIIKNHFSQLINRSSP